MVTGWRVAVGTLSSMEAKAGCGCSAGGVFPGVLPGMGTQQCWGRTRRRNGSSDVPMSHWLGTTCHRDLQLGMTQLWQLSSQTGKVGYGYETSLGRAKNSMPKKLFIFSKQRNVTRNIIESDREYMVLPLQCILLKIMNTKQIAKEIQILQRKRRGRKRGEQE